MGTPTPPQDWWFQQSPDPFWQWVALIAGLIAFGLAVMALPMVMQMIWGKPRAEFAFTDSDREPLSGLVCHLSQPFVSKWLERIGVSRPDARITVTWSISLVATGKIVAMKPLAKVMDFDNQTTTHPVLSSSLIPMWSFVLVKRKNGITTALNDANTVLPPDTYDADVYVLLGGREQNRATRRFVVTTTGVRWLAA